MFLTLPIIAARMEVRQLLKSAEVGGGRQKNGKHATLDVKKKLKYFAYTPESVSLQKEFF